jgi:hypothetical protein
MKIWRPMMSTIDRLHALLQAIDGPASRNALVKIRAGLKPKSKGTDGDNIVRFPPIAVAHEAPDQAGTHFNLTSPIAAIFVEPGKSDLSRLKKDFIAAGEPLCLGLGQAIAEDAVLIASARVGDLPIIADKLALWKFKRFSHIYLLSPPTGPDLMNAAALAVCERGASKLPSLDEWPVDKDPTELAHGLLSGIGGRRVHLFAKAESHGWESIIGDANWSTETDDA